MVCDIGLSKGIQEQVAKYDVMEGNVGLRCKLKLADLDKNDILYCAFLLHLGKCVVIFATRKEDVDNAKGDDCKVLATECGSHSNFFPTFPAAIRGLTMQCSNRWVMRYLECFFCGL